MSSIKLWIYKLLTWWFPESRFHGVKVALLRWAGAKIGTNVRIYSSASFIGVGKLEIGDDVHIGGQVLMTITEGTTLKIGSRIDIGPRVMILTGTHEINPLRAPDPNATEKHAWDGHAAGKGASKPVTIEDGVWLGAGSVILPGNTVGEGSVIGAASVVTKSIEPWSVAVGCPAKVIRRR